MNKLKQIYQEIDELNTEIPAQMAKQITLYAKALQLIGRYHASSINKYGQAYAERKRIYGQAIYETSGTAKDKEAAAEMESFEARQVEADAEYEVWEWRRAFESTQEIIQALKIEHKTLMDEYNGKGSD